MDSDDPIQVLLERQLGWAQPRTGTHQGSVCARSKVHASDPGIPRIACPGQSNFGETTRSVEHPAVTADVEQFANELINGPDAYGPFVSLGFDGNRDALADNLPAYQGVELPRSPADEAGDVGVRFNSGA
ncbi:hypothetical protein [Streptomyces sp. N1]|uniref:hypothetical protein n=1 Tax=Streptomyces sp. N1 TaxID=576456 RepID=UPI001F50FED7|nr:hypothetical protein [Streptomyces sp. N1]